MQSALVLNATYEPLSVVPVRRAVCLVLAEKAEIVHDDGGELRSARISVPRPVVIRLRYVVKVPYHRRTALSRNLGRRRSFISIGWPIRICLPATWGGCSSDRICSAPSATIIR